MAYTFTILTYIKKLHKNIIIVDKPPKCMFLINLYNTRKALGFI